MSNDHGCMRSKTITCDHTIALLNSRYFFVLNKTISRKKATSIALREVPGATPLSWELEDDNDQAIWKINLVENSQKRVVKINAVTKHVM